MKLIPLTPLTPLTRGKYAMVDDDCFEYLNRWKWKLHTPTDGSKRHYAVRKEKVKNGIKHVSMHSVVCGFPPRTNIDHRDRNGLNNQKNNLRSCSTSQNGANSRKSRNNTSGFKGVTWQKIARKWQSQLMHNRKHYYLGLFEDPKEAAKAYDVKAVQIFGEFAATNEQLGLI